MKKYQNIVAAVTLIMMLSSCYRLAFNSIGVMDNSVAIKKASNTQKEIIFIPMHHIGKRDFYRDVKIKIDSLRKLGFVFYYEGIKFSRDNDSLKNDTLAMKLRKVIGLDMRAMRAQGGYIDTITNSLMGLKVKSVAKYELVNQPKPTYFFDTLADRRVDAFLSDAISAFEKKYGNVELSECDFSTRPNDKYHCKKYKKKKGKNFIIIQYRDEFLANEISRDTHNKIAIIYGAKHFNGVMKNLQKEDSTWKVN